MNLPERCRLIADIIENDLPFEVKHYEKGWDGPDNNAIWYADMVEDYPEIRLFPMPEMIFLGPKEVPPGCAIRQIGSDSWGIVTSIDCEGIYVANIGKVLFSQLHPTYEIKRPGEEDWQLCQKAKS